MQYLFVASGSITLFILTLILGKDKKVKADYILGWILLILLENFISLFLLNQPDSSFPVWKELIFEFSEASIFLHGPLLWFYTRSLSEKNFVLTRLDVIHFASFLLAFVYFLAGVFKIIAVTENARNFLLVLKLLSVLGYTVWSLLLLKKHQKQIKNIFSNLEQKKLTWLRFLCWSILTIGCIAALSLLVDRLTVLTIPQYGGIITNVALCAFVYILGYFGFKQEFIFQPLTNKPSGEEKYAKSGLSLEKLEEAFQKVEGHMNKAKPYLDAELTLFSLSEQLQLMPNHLSQIINSYSGSNFHDFIHRYRVEEAKNKIASDEVLNTTLLGIGLSCGFSSKSTFNRAFKKHTGVNPSEYKLGK